MTVRFALLAALLSSVGGPAVLAQTASEQSAPDIQQDIQQDTQDAVGGLPLALVDIEPSRLPVERLVVVGSKEARYDIPGSATYIGDAQLELFEYQDIHRILRMAPGVNIQEEDGFGLRPNIGLRGTSVERSEKITLMEDGVLIAPAPYAAPAAYYFPTAGRLEAVEVRKGSSAIKFGPRTVGGAINLVSRSIPKEFGGFVDARIGEFDLLTVHAAVGGSTEHLGFVAETFQSEADGFKQLDGGGNTGFDVEDYLVKFRVNTGEETPIYQALEVKFGYTDSDSNETYLGLTDEDFAATPFRRYAASQLDNIDTRHWQVQATHFIQFNDAVDVTTVGYYNDFRRDWFKVDDLDFGDGRFRTTVLFDSPQAFQSTLSGLRGVDVTLDEAIAVRGQVLDSLRGDADSPDDAIQLRHNAREYYSAGVQTIVGLRFDTGAVSHELEMSVRYHEDEEDRLQNRENYRIENGTLVLTSIDPPGSQGNRVSSARAWAYYIQDEITWGRFRFVPGLRLEDIELTREDFGRDDPDRTEGPTGTRENDLFVAIPGLGIFYDATDNLTLLAGVHRGFNPPGTGDNDAEEETSVSYEAGFFYTTGQYRLEVIGFYSDVNNILGTCTNAVGCTEGDFGDQFNGGAVDVIGLEVAGEVDIPTGWDGIVVPLRFNYTFTDAEFAESFADSFWGDVQDGDQLPYIPSHQFYASAGLAGPGWAVLMSADYVSEIRTEAGQGPIPALERIEGRVVFDLAGHWQVTNYLRLFGEVQNLFDNTYAVARRPYGLRPGKPQTVIGGLQVTV